MCRWSACRSGCCHDNERRVTQAPPNGNRWQHLTLCRSSSPLPHAMLYYVCTQAADVCKRPATQPAASSRLDASSTAAQQQQQQQLVMCGSASAHLATQLSALPATDLLGRAALISAFFAAPGPPSVMWSLAAAAAAHLAATHVRAVPGEGSMQHVAAVRMALLGRANQLELVAGGKGRVGGMGSVGAAKKEDVLRDAALLHLQAGNLEQCCELQIQVRGRSLDGIRSSCTRCLALLA